LRRVNERGRIQLILARKVYPRDEPGKRIIEKTFRYKNLLRGEIENAYLENYNVEIAANLISGVDVWLNTPLPIASTHSSASFC
jgi:starch phosphorylase